MAYAKQAQFRKTYAATVSLPEDVASFADQPDIWREPKNITLLGWCAELSGATPG